MTFDYSEEDFAKWLSENRLHFQCYAPNEIARLALAAGFSLATVCGPVGDLVSHIRRLQKFHDDNEGLRESWMELRSYQKSGTLWF